MMTGQETGRIAPTGWCFLRGAASVAMAALAVVALAAGSAGAADFEGRRHIAVSGEGSVSVLPDIARADLGTRVTGETVSEAMGQARLTMQRILDSLNQAGVADKDILTTRFAIHRERVPGRGEERQEERYAVTNMVGVTIRDLDRADSVLDLAIDAGANEVRGIRFAIEDEDEVAAEARQLAAAQARAKAQQLARLHGVTLGEPIRIAESGAGAGPRPMYARSAGLAAESATVTVGELTFTARLEVVYEIEAE